MVNIGILGCGRVAQHYMRLFQSGEIRKCKVVAVYDPDLKKAREMAQHFLCRISDSMDDFFSDESVTLVLILTPSGLHYPHSRSAIMRGKHLLVEKPLAMIPSQFSELEYLAAENNVAICVGFQNRFNPAIEFLNKALASKLIGEIVSVAVRLRWCRTQEYYNDGWHGTWLMDGGVLNQQAIHHIDILAWLLGPVKSVAAFAAQRANDLEAEDTAVACLKLENGALGTIEVTTAARPRDFEASISVTGSAGCVNIGGIALNRLEQVETINGRYNDKELSAFSTIAETGYGRGHIPLINAYVSNLLSENIPLKEKSPVPVSTVMHTTDLIHGIYSSIETGLTVDLADRKVSKFLGIGQGYGK